MAILDIKVPDIGDFTEVTVIELMVGVGDTVKPDQSLITVESDKASMEIPCSHAGVVKELKVAVSAKAKEGSLVLTLEAAGDAAAPVLEQKKAPAFVSVASGATQKVAPATAAPAPAAASFEGMSHLDIGKTIHPHPTLGESIGMAAEVAYGSCTDLPPARE